MICEDGSVISRCTAHVAVCAGQLQHACGCAVRRTCTEDRFKFRMLNLELADSVIGIHPVSEHIAFPVNDRIFICKHIIRIHAGKTCISE